MCCLYKFIVPDSTRFLSKSTKSLIFFFLFNNHHSSFISSITSTFSSLLPPLIHFLLSGVDLSILIVKHRHTEAPGISCNLNENPIFVPRIIVITVAYYKIAPLICIVYVQSSTHFHLHQLFVLLVVKFFFWLVSSPLINYYIIHLLLSFKSSTFIHSHWNQFVAGNCSLLPELLLHPPNSSLLASLVNCSIQSILHYYFL